MTTSSPRTDLTRSAHDTASASFEQAKNPARGAQFLQIVAKPKRAVARGKSQAKPESKLTRVAFRVSRLLEFCRERELENQTGHSVYDWPLVVAKELFDNGLDACEEAEVPPDITVIVEPDTIVVQDNANGIAADTIESVLDYTIRVSSREAYVSPTRGAQGNALKTILAMSYVLGRKSGGGGDAAGVTVIESRGVAHRIEFRVDHVINQPRIVHTTAASSLEVGTKITVYWPPSKLLEYAAARFKQLVQTYTWLNPHMSVRGVWFDHEFINVKATNPHWEKWRPRNPTSVFWYDEARLQRYLAAHVARDRDLGQRRTVREFIAEFRGLSGTVVQRKILNEVGCSHQSLASFFGADQVNRAGVARLLAAMRKYSKPVAPKHLGVIGGEHLKRRFLAAGGNIDTFKYQCHSGMTSDDIPYVVEFAFGLHQAGLAPDGGAPRLMRAGEGRVALVGQDRVFITGVNWSAAINNPFRHFGSTGEGLENTLAKVRANGGQPVICALHLASARIQFADRGKSSIILTDDAEQPDD
jgi:DNA topoisomerase VI subunit B